jgi:dissimilatory sulfite reductase (desulfoviridin) alpha/beta subunit
MKKKDISRWTHVSIIGPDDRWHEGIIDRVDVEGEVVRVWFPSHVWVTKKELVKWSNRQGAKCAFGGLL